MKTLRVPVILALAWALVACQSLGVPKAETFNQKIAAAYISVQTMVDLAATLYTTGKLSDADKDNVVEQASTAKAGLDIARQVYSTDPAGADAKLQSILLGLNALSVYLNARKSS